MNAFLALLPVLQTAWGVVSSFTGNAQAAKVNTAVQDAVKVITAVTPLVQQFASGKEVTPDEVRVALVGMDDELAAFDAEITKREVGG